MLWALTTGNTGWFDAITCNRHRPQIAVQRQDYFQVLFRVIVHLKRHPRAIRTATVHDQPGFRLANQSTCGLYCRTGTVSKSKTRVIRISANGKCLLDSILEQLGIPALDWPAAV